MVGDTTDGLPWKNRAVTFLENHDTGYRTNEDGTPQEHHEFDSFANGWEVEQGYAQILTHPGVPTVYWKHYFDWGADLRNRIRAPDQRQEGGGRARRQRPAPAGQRAREGRLRRAGGRAERRSLRADRRRRRGVAAVHSGYAELPRVRPRCRLEGLGGPAGQPRNSRQAPLRPALPIPDYRDPASFEIPDDLLN